ncbi:MAG: hypothetical protein VYA30_06250 [Myxococcota bacterium]|nr:hypothetical protein [Myxococcota bacterium]
MKRLACLAILLAGFGCDGGGDSDGSNPDGTSSTDAVVSDGGQDAMNPGEDTGPANDGGALSDRGLVPTDSGMSPPDQMLDPDASTLEQCRAIGRCTPEGAWCEPAGSPECWRGESPQCFEPLHPLSRANCDQPAELMAGACVCPDGFDVAPGQDSCASVSSQRAVQHAISRPVCSGVQTSRYGTDGAHYEDTDGNPDNDRVISDRWGPQSPDDQTSGRLNQAGVWACDWQVRDQAGFEPFNEWIGFSHCLSTDTPGDYLVGISGDEQARLMVNGQLVFETPQGIDASRTWYIRRLSLPSGINTIEFHGLNTDSIGAIGGEIIGPFEPGSMATEAAQKAADYENNILFSTRSMVGTQFSLGDMTGWYCRNEGEVLNTCHAEPRCSTIERTACEMPPLVCPMGQHEVDGACVDNECTCAFGVPLLGADCPENGAPGCRACFEGYGLEEGVCVENVCTCENGVAAVSAACDQHNAEICLVCDDGYEMQNRRCEPWQCVCANGTAAEGAACPAEGDEFCLECDAGFHLDGAVCRENVCQCRNGQVDADAFCEFNNGDACQACDDGFYLEEGRCRPNLCQCENGNGAIGAACPANGDALCTECMNGFQLVDGACQPNQCVCINGVGAQGLDCPNPGRLQCESCDEGYRLEGRICVQSDCRCANGRPVSPDLCPGIGVNLCRDCNDGYTLVDGQCQANTCECVNGEPAVGELCLVEGEPVCINCDPGFVLEGDDCVAQQCACANGVASQGIQCPQAGAEHCQRCDEGYRLRDNRCELIPVPRCDDGIVNGTETDVDCGGECEPCGVGDECDGPNDCESDRCDHQCGDPDQCELTCQPAAVCGDSVVEDTETCDDGNAVTEDCAYGEINCTVCAADCTEQPGAIRLCGDGIVDPEEQCDDNNTVTEDCAYGEANCTVCAADCTEQPGVTHVCGEGTIDRDNGETCDDNNTITEDCAYGEANCTVCAADCTEQPGVTHVCGDGAVDRGDGETCDDNNTITEDCAYGQANCTVCAADCTEQPGATRLCGDGTVDRQDGETCDDNNTVTEECDYGELNCTICAADCTEQAGTPQFCGDGRVNGPEQCDDNNTETEECDYGQFACTVCAADCTEQPGRTRRCGDGVVDAQDGETCDDQNQNSNDDCTNECQLPACDDQIRNGQESDVDCGGACEPCRDDFICNQNDDCQSNRCGPPCGDIRQCPTVCLPAPVCGNGIIEDGEDCDDGNAFTEDCAYGDQNCQVCDARCQTVDGRTSYCGDGRVDDANGESCDDNNQNNGDECTNACTLPACDDQIRNGQESDVDCGGPCEPCREGDLCNGPNDCDTNRCGIDDVQPGEVIGPADAECDAGQVQGGVNQDAQAANGAFANDERLFAVEYRVPDGADLDIDEVEFYLGQTFVQSEVYLFTHDPKLGRPGELVARATFTIQREEDWQGGRFGRAITLQAGSIYWLGLKLMGGRSSFAVGGVGVNYTSKLADGDRWDRVFEGPIMARVSLCDDAVGADCDADGNCPQVCLPPAVCGNGIIEGAETCDDGNLRIENCDYGQESCTVCDDQCQQINGATSFCGDGILDVANGEACDDGDDNDANGCNNSCEEQVACQGCECDVDRCVAGDAPAVIDTLNFNGMTFRPLDLDECVPGEGNCCPGSTTQSSLDAFCRLAGHCRAIDWSVEVLQRDNCYGWGGCTRCTWFSNFCFGGATDRRYITSVTCL